MARLRGEGSCSEPEKWFLATFFGEVIGLVYMLATSILDLRGLMVERDRDG